MIRKGFLSNMDFPIEKSEFICNFPCNMSIDDGLNKTNNHTIIPAMDPPGYTDSTIPVIIVYCILFVITAAGNLSVVITLFRSRRHRKSRVSLMICHLAVADLMVAFIMIPLEIGWRITIQWYAGNIACKVFLFLRAFCLYLSSNVLVCVSLDRCFAVIYPLRVSAARKRGKIMLAAAWITALVNSIPQSIIFRVLQHPDFPNFKQCVTFNYFSNDNIETLYNLFCLIAMYFLPLFIISAAYSVILCEISNRSSRSKAKDDGDTTSSGVLRLRCSDLTHIERARQRTLRLTVTIVVVFVWCWTPYVVMTLWYMFDRESAKRVDNTIQDGLFLMAVSNSCMNPLIYGSYAMKCRLWNRRRGNDVVLGAATVALQRRSTDAGSGIIPVQDKNKILHLTPITQKTDINGVLANNYIRNITNNRKYLTGTLTRTSAVTKFTGNNIDGKKNREQQYQPHHHINFNQNNYQKQQKQQKNFHQTKMIHYPSSDQIAIIEEGSVVIGPRPSFHSDPIQNNFDGFEIGNGLTRSLDTGGWR